MKHISAILFALALVVGLALPFTGPQPAQAQDDLRIVVIGKSVAPYWSNVETGVRAAAEALGLGEDQVIFFVPPREDVAAQIQAMETYIAQGVTGIAIAPSDPNALEPVMQRAADAGILVTTLDTPPVENSASLVYIGTDNYTAGRIAGEAMKQLLPDGGLVGIGRGSDTALNALQRTDGFLDAIEGSGIEALEPVNDREDAATALQLANSVISANPDLAGAFGVYAYNGPAWATAINEAGRAGDIKLVAFDATTDVINYVMGGVIHASIAQREYDMGYRSVEVIKMMAQYGVDQALEHFGAVDGIIDTGVDVVTAGNLADYEASLDEKGIPHEWSTEGWEAPADAFNFVMPDEEAAAPEMGEPMVADEDLRIVVIGKSVAPYWSNVETGVRAAAEALGLGEDQVIFFVPPREDVAAQIQAMETYIAQGVTGIAIAPSDPNALEPVMQRAADAGILVTTLDTPPVENSASLVYIGTDNYTAGRIAGEAMKQLLPDGGLVGIGRGSDTALNALQRTDGFLDAIEGSGIEALEPVNDREDAATALQLANSVISANPDLAGAFGVYAYNGPAWATAINEAGRAGDIKLVAFDATTDVINYVMGGVIHASIAQREYDMGYRSVEVIKMMAQYGVDQALEHFGAVDGIIDTGVDVVTAGNLADYEASLDEKGIPHEWSTEGWEVPADAFLFEMPEM